MPESSAFSSNLVPEQALNALLEIALQIRQGTSVEEILDLAVRESHL